MEKNIDNLKDEFYLIPLDKKSDYIQTLEEMELDEEMIEIISELKMQLSDLKSEAEIEVDTQCNILISTEKAKLYKCIKSIDSYIEGHSYYIFIDSIKESLLDKWVGSPFTEFIIKMKDIIWIISDNGIGTLKFKSQFTQDFNTYFE